MNIQALLRPFVVPAACSLLLAAPLSQAVPLDPTGFANGSETFTLTASFTPVENPVPAGGFVGTFGGPSPLPIINLTFWCADITQTFGFNPPPPYYNYSASADTNLNLRRLFGEVSASDRVSSTLNSAAFQLDIWEILYETAAPFDLTTGNFKASGDAATLVQANTWLLGLAAATPSTSVFDLTSAGHAQQNFVTDVVLPTTLITVPEPGSLVLLGAGMFAAMFAMRRRTPKVGRQ